MPLPAPRTAEGLAMDILPWLRAKMPGVAIVLPPPVRPSAGGSSETYFLEPRCTANGQERILRLVLRIEATGEGIYESPSIVREYRIMEALGQASGVPVPRVAWLETDCAVLGAPFLVMERVEGRIPGSFHHSAGYLADATVADREAIWTSAIATMAKLHAVDPAGLGFLGTAVDGLEREQQRWERYAQWSEIPVRREQERALRWLSDNKPQVPSTGFAWGDARPENMIFRDCRCVAVIDWETASLAGAETDLGWWLFFDWMIAEGAGNPRLDGVPGRTETLHLWEGFAGRKLRDMEWHEVFATWRFSLISDRAMLLARRKGTPGARPADALSGAARRLVQLIGS